MWCSPSTLALLCDHSTNAPYPRRHREYCWQPAAPFNKNVLFHLNSLSLSLSLLASHVFLLITEADHQRLRRACVPVGGVEKQGHLEARENWLDKVTRTGINRVGHA